MASRIRRTADATRPPKWRSVAVVCLASALTISGGCVNDEGGGNAEGEMRGGMWHVVSTTTYPNCPVLEPEIEEEARVVCDAPKIEDFFRAIGGSCSGTMEGGLVDLQCTSEKSADGCVFRLALHVSGTYTDSAFDITFDSLETLSGENCSADECDRMVTREVGSWVSDDGC